MKKDHIDTAVVLQVRRRLSQLLVVFRELLNDTGHIVARVLHYVTLAFPIRQTLAGRRSLSFSFERLCKVVFHRCNLRALSL